MLSFKRWSLAGAVTVITAGTLTALAANAQAGTPGRPDSGTAYVATTPKTAGTTQYIAGFDTDGVLGDTAITYVITTVPTSTTGVVSLSARQVRLYTGRGELSGTATATLTAGADGSAMITGGELDLTVGTGTLRGHRLIATFTGTGHLDGGYTFNYQGTFR